MTIPNSTYKSQSSLKKETWLTLIEISFSLVVFSTLVLYAYSNIYLEPFLGFSYNPNSGLVTSIESASITSLKIDDVILSINGIPTQEIIQTDRDNLLTQIEEGDFLTLQVARGNKEFEVQIQKQRQSERRIIDLLSSDWILPLPFFGAGLITTLFIRPRTKTRSLLILFFYFFALWIGAGTISNTGYWYSKVVLRTFIWLSLPVSFQLHWNFPKPFKLQKKWINILGYSVVLCIIIADFLKLTPPNTFYIGFLLTILSSFVLLFIKFIRFTDIRRVMRSLMTGYLLAILPLIFMVVLSLIGNSPAKANFSLLGLTALPGFYFFTAYQLHINRKIRNISLTMNFYSLGILVQFVLNFLILIIPPSLIPPNGINFISFLIINFIVVTGFGILLVIPALANDQTDLFLSETYTLRISANRSAAFINFILILAPVSLLFLLGFSGGDNQSFGNTLVYMTIVIVCVSISLIIYPKYSAFFNRVILGIRHPPEELIRNYAHRITTSLDISSLAQLLTTEILPSLLIRESALFYFAGQSRVKKLFSTGVKLDDQKVIQALCMNLPSSIQNLKINDDDILPWAHFILPLQIESDVLGIWVFGRKDPDNIYDQELIKDLKSLGNQTTLALLNIRQASLLQALYESNIDRQEAQKAGIARDLHDVLLPSIGYLAELQSNNCDTLEFEEAVQRVNNMVREIMSGLRPSSLDMGLTIAIEELADEPEAQIGGKINIFAELNTPATPIYYDKLVELHLYRMVQQACRNALVHAHAGAVHIKGSLTEDTIDLVVEDDGIGLPFEGMPDLGLLIINRHFGLANIVERAKIIHADVQIESKPNKGARLHFRWTAGEPSA